MAFEVFVNGGFRVIALTPGSVGKHAGRQILDDSIKYHTVASDCCQWGIGLQLREHMVMGVVAIEANKDLFFAVRALADLVDDFLGNARTLNHLDSARHGVFQDRLAVVFTDINVNAKHLRISGAAARRIQPTTS